MRHRKRSYLHELLTAILLVNSGERSRRRLAHEFRHVARARVDFRLRKSCVRLHDVIPRPRSKPSHRNVYTSRGQRATRILQHVVIRQRALDGVRGVQLKLAVAPGGFEETVHELVRRGHGQVEPERVQHLLFHLQDLLARVRAIADVNKVAHLRRPDLFILARHQHRGDADELQVFARHGFQLEESIDQVCGQEQRLRHEFKLQVHLDEPIDENGAHLAVDVALNEHVRLGHLRLRLDFVPVLVNVVDVLCRAQRIVVIVKIDIRQCIRHDIPTPRASLEIGGIRLAHVHIRARRRHRPSGLVPVSRFAVARALRRASPSRSDLLCFLPERVQHSRRRLFLLSRLTTAARTQ